MKSVYNTVKREILSLENSVEERWKQRSLWYG